MIYPRLPIRIKLTLWYTSLLAAILLALGTFVTLRLRADLVSRVDQQLQLAGSEISVDASGASESEFRDVTDKSLGGLPRAQSSAQLLTADGRVVDSAGSIIGTTALIAPAQVRAVLGGSNLTQTIHPSASMGGFRLFALPFAKGPGPEVLVVATSLAEVDRSVHQYLTLALIAGPAALAGAAASGWWLARSSLRPVARMTQAAADIGAAHLSERVAVPPASDELRRLAVTMNAMLDRLQGAVEQQRRFVSDASHELRTPLAVMSAELDVSLGSASLSAPARDVLTSTREEVERMSRIVSDLLTLARLDEGRLELGREPVSLHEVAADVVALMYPLAQERDVRLQLLGEGGVVAGDRDRLQHVLSNLVDNALKYAGRGGKVDVIVRDGAPEVTLEVTDTGPGIPAEALPHVFERFFRADPARSGPGTGSGLGLAICKEIVQAHRGRIWAHSEPGQGTSVLFSLPAWMPSDLERGKVASGS